jgi:hypothetical protein
MRPVFGQLLSTRTVFIGIAAILVLQVLFLYAPFMHEIFGSAPLPGTELLGSVLEGAIILAVVGVERWRRRRALPPRAAAS